MPHDKQYCESRKISRGYYATRHNTVASRRGHSSTDCMVRSGISYRREASTRRSLGGLSHTRSVCGVTGPSGPVGLTGVTGPTGPTGTIDPYVFAMVDTEFPGVFGISGNSTIDLKYDPTPFTISGNVTADADNVTIFDTGLYLLMYTFIFASDFATVPVSVLFNTLINDLNIPQITEETISNANGFTVYTVSASMTRSIDANSTIRFTMTNQTANTASFGGASSFTLIRIG